LASKSFTAFCFHANMNFNVAELKGKMPKLSK